MTIEFKIGQFYRTRNKRKFRLFGIRKDGTLFFDTEGEEWETRNPDGSLYEHRSDEEDIVSEWREPHRHEHFIWALTGIRTNQDMSHVLGVDCNKWSSTQTDRWRKFKVTIEEILE